jgi:hypothetical protein
LGQAIVEGRLTPDEIVENGRAHQRDEDARQNADGADGEGCLGQFLVQDLFWLPSHAGKVAPIAFSDD